MAIETGYIPLRIKNAITPEFKEAYQTDTTWSASQTGLVNVPDNRLAADYYTLNVNDWMVDGKKIFDLDPAPTSVKIYAQERGATAWGEVTNTAIDTEVTVSIDGGTTWTAIAQMDSEATALTVDSTGSSRADTGQILVRTPDVSAAQENLRFVVKIDYL